MSFKLYKVDLSINFVNFISKRLKGLAKNYGKVVFISANKRPIRFVEKSIDIDTSLKTEFYTIEEFARTVVTNYSDNLPIFHTKIEREIYFLDLIKGDENLNKRIGLDDAGLLSWAKRLSRLFDEIDRQLLENKIKNFQYIEALPEAVSILENLKDLYVKYRKENENITYGGDIFRRAAKLTSEESFRQNYTGAIFIFTGLVYLSNSEVEIIKNIDEFADIDFYVQTDLMDRERGVERFETFKVVDNLSKRLGKSVKNLDIEEIKPDSYTPSKIHFFQFTDTHNEAKKAVTLIEDKYKSFKNKYDSSNLAVILPDSKTLFPLLSYLENIEDLSLNISLGMPLKSTEVGVFVETLFMLLVDIKRKESIGVANSADSKTLLRFLNSSLLSLFKEQIINDINWIKNEIVKSEASVFQLDSNRAVFKKLLAPFLQTKNLIQLEEAFKNLFDNLDESKLRQETAKLSFQILQYFYFEVINNFRLIDKDRFGDLPFFYKLLSEIINDIIIPYEGHPLQGIQIMGMLEARLLTFENIVITDVNEGVLPSGDKIDPLLPESVKIELGLTSFKEKEMLMRYNFFRLIYSAKNTYILFKSGATGSDKFIRSRFVEQLLLIKEKNEKREIKIDSVPFSIPRLNKIENYIPKGEVESKFIDSIKHFSPSALNSYMKCPYSYYLKYIKAVPDRVRFDRDFEADTLGSIVHKYFEIHFGKVLGKILDEKLLDNVEYKILEDIKRLPEFLYEDRDNRIKNFLGRLTEFQIEGLKIILERRVKDYFKNIKSAGEIFKILETEKDIVNFGLKLKGRIDRVDELRDGRIRVIDYKTGSGKNTPYTRKVAKLIEMFDDIKDIYDDKNLTLVRDSLNSAQLPCYILLARECYEKDIISEIHYIGKKDRDFREVLTDENIDDYKKLIDYIMSHMKMTDKIYALPKEDICKFCEYESFCKFSV
ncbi:PD-(D/E)XK nuclease family protein [Deferribacterales bacterium Es71-Z0220]|uniref:PD-(D/E)XK nuclease family protein n=1 Tax=Deferrivibrio essentukiensis TaxID=2880922 RepID=UPI001F61BB1F|nr:PD-(D/E)XK nuclease family protein [Deferrivibrio essentukiensis]MCB4204607.1 PD-(D/E)XK nuclease family protein [Deferrivibrio essentukiensis]